VVDAAIPTPEQLREAALQDSFSLLGVEIFKAGKWNGDEYSVADLDAMVSASKEVGFTPALKAGHSKDDSAPALGWVENLRRKGESLYADLVALPESVYNAIKRRSYDAVSAEIFLNIERAGKRYAKVLKGLALLGAEPPAVDLKPLHAFLSAAPLPAAQFSVYSVELAQMEPDADGNCAEGYEKGEDGMCHLVTSTNAVPVTVTVASTTTTASNANGTASTTFTITSVPKESKSMADTTETVELKHGQIVVDLEEVKTLRADAAKVAAMSALEAERAALREQLAEVEAQKRQERINHRLRDLKVPALRPFVRVFYDLAMQTPAVKTYSVADPKVQISAETVVDQLIEAVNKQADTIFRTLSVDVKKTDDPDEPDAPQAKVDYRVKRFMAKNATADYKTALKAVLAADPELNESYIRS